MSLFNPVPEGEIGTKYKYLGWLLFCPIYIDSVDTQDPQIIERNGIPTWVFDAAVWMSQSIIWCLSAMDPMYEPAFALRITHKLEVDD